MTDGILLNEIHHDPLLMQYDTVIIDEAHERSLNIDFLLGYIKKIIKKRPDLKVIITSATIDPESFSNHFNGAPIIMIEGRTYPVEILYRDYGKEDASVNNLQSNILQAIDECSNYGDGDILVFLATEKDIHETKKYLTKVFEHKNKVDVLPLFSRLSQKEQNLIFHPKGKKRIILATNVAETSVTVPRIDFVIDTGKARISKYSVSSKIQHFPIEEISQASARQRAGRCGRLRPGTVFRLYSKENFEARKAFTPAEILRTNLAFVILNMKALNLGEIEHFPFIDPPEKRQINDGYKLLFELLAVDKKNRISQIGRQLIKFPIDPQCAKMLITASNTGCLSELLIIVAAISIQDPKERPHDKKQAADSAHKAFQHKDSDFLSYLNLFNEANNKQKSLSQNKYRKWCKQNFISYQRMREWFDIHKQLSQTCIKLNLKQNENLASYTSIHQAIISGIATHVSVKDEKFDYLGTRNRKMRIFPGSVLFKKPPKHIIALEIAQTSNIFARTVAKIELSWVELWVEHLISKTYSEPSWKKKSGIVSAIQTNSLYGLTLSSNKQVNYCSVDPKLSHDLFIRHALVYGQWRTRAKFLLHNLKLIDSVIEKENRIRRKDLLVNDEWLEQFYKTRIKKDICTGADFEKWAKKHDTKALYLTEDQVLQSELNENLEEQFPGTLNFGAIELPLTYHFCPGDKKDGMVLTIPSEVLPQINELKTQWLVPGFIEDKCINILKTMPKPLRKKVVPIPSFVRDFLSSDPCSEKSLFTQLANYLKRQKNVIISPKELQNQTIEPFFLMGFQLVDKTGQNLEFSKSLQNLKTKNSQQNSKNKAQSIMVHKDIKKWDFSDLQEIIYKDKGSYKVQTYPALSLKDGLLQIHLLNDKQQAKISHKQGLVELIKRQIKEQVKYALKNLTNIEGLCLRLSKIQDCQSLSQDIINNNIIQLFLTDENQEIRKKEIFNKTLENNKNKFQNAINDYSEVLMQVLDYRQVIINRINKNIPLGWAEALADIKDQDNHLIYKGFINNLPITQLRNYIRYYKAITIRLDTLAHNPEKDRINRIKFLPIWEQYKKLLNNTETNKKQTETLKDIRWKIEELRISLFAQQIKTNQKISVKRIEKLFNKYPQI